MLIDWHDLLPLTLFLFIFPLIHSCSPLFFSLLLLHGCFLLFFSPVVPVKVAPPTERAPSLLLRVNLTRVCLCLYWTVLLVSTDDAVLLWTLLVIIMILIISTLWIYNKWSAKSCKIQCRNISSSCLFDVRSERQVSRLSVCLPSHTVIAHPAAVTESCNHQLTSGL